MVDRIEGTDVLYAVNPGDQEETLAGRVISPGRAVYLAERAPYRTLLWETHLQTIRRTTIMTVCFLRLTIRLLQR